MQNQSSYAKPVQSLNIGRIVSWILLIVIIFISIFPFWVALKTALSDRQEIFSRSAEFFPAGFTLYNFGRALGVLSPEQLAAGGGGAVSLNMLIALRNSLVFVGVCVFGQIVFSSMAAYAFARLRFPGRNFLFVLILSALMIPGIVLFIPNFILMKDLGWLNTFQGMIAPFVLMTPFAVFFLRQFFLSIPLELEEAARLDGASPFMIFWRIVLPLSTGPISTLCILSGIGLWNEYFWPYLVANRDESLRVLPVALQVFKSQQPSGPPDWTGIMAGTFLSVIPAFLLLIFLGRQVVESLQFSGSK
jgi:multiple sugar transport system permease protein